MQKHLILSILLLLALSIQKIHAQPMNPQEITFSGMTFNVRLAGNEGGIPVIMLHGWPETSYMWVGLMEKLAAEGYRCIAPDQRGLSPKARPAEVSAYHIRELANDVISLADTLGIGRFHLIGHDWGSAIGWAVVTLHPERVISWTAMSVPHLRAFADAIRHDPKQRKMSRYMGWFQWKGLAEWFLLRKDAKVLRDTYRKMPADHTAEYLRVLGNKETMRASLNYYRANYRLLKKGDEVKQFGDISTPTLMLWGKKDFALGRTGIENTAQYIKGPYRLVELQATHWLMQEVPEECGREILRHLREN
jgi:pimeloyl-ACP methyl ester carboxylesterase